MSATVTAKGQITIPKEVRDLLEISPGNKVDFRRNKDGEFVLVKDGGNAQSRIARMRGTAPRQWTTDELMALLRGDD
jgi:AbrB family looped-hinge helix DNA binding protein